MQHMACLWESALHIEPTCPYLSSNISRISGCPSSVPSYWVSACCCSGLPLFVAVPHLQPFVASVLDPSDVPLVALVVPSLCSILLSFHLLWRFLIFINIYPFSLVVYDLPFYQLNSLLVLSLQLQCQLQLIILKLFQHF